ncbi:MAG: VTT domain-containing protein [Candidatus Lokiarchaeota archaeon]|nr:VTT domain-containing protein [Candidatus Lokiarchaeota archaeon]
MVFMKRLSYIFIIIYILVVSYLLLFFTVQPFQDFVIDIRHNISSITEGANYIIAIVISLVICFLGSASIGFPVPFPFVLFSLSNSIFMRYSAMGLDLNEILMNFNYWAEVLGIAMVGGLGSALGEFTGYYVGYGAKKLGEKKDSEFLKNIDGFAKIVLKNKKATPFMIFLFALTPLPDDILFLPLGMMKYPFWKCIIPGWLGKNFTTILYCLIPVFLQFGFDFLGFGGEQNDVRDVVTEIVLLLFTISIMFFIMGFNWNKFLKERKEKKIKKSKNISIGENQEN